MAEESWAERAAQGVIREFVPGVPTQEAAKKAVDAQGGVPGLVADQVSSGVGEGLKTALDYWLEKSTVTLPSGARVNGVAFWGVVVLVALAGVVGLLRA